MLIIADGFDHWGSAARMLQGVYLHSSGVINTAIKRTGSSSYFMEGTATLTYAIPTPVNVMGIGHAFYTAAMGNTPQQKSPLATWLNSDNIWIAYAWFGIDGRIGITVNPDYPNFINPNFPAEGQAPWDITPICETDPGTVTAGSFIHVEFELECGNPGSAKIAVNSVIEATYSGPLCVLAENAISFGGIRRGNFQYIGSSDNPPIYVDDFFIRDDTTDENNTLLGDRVAITRLVNADTAFADFVPSSGTELWPLLDEVPANDGGYGLAEAVDDVSEFEKAPLGIDTTGIAGIVLFGRFFKTDAGPAAGRLGVHSGAFIHNDEEQSAQLSPAYFRPPVFPLDPNGDIPWTKESWDAATVRATRTT